MTQIDPATPDQGELELPATFPASSLVTRKLQEFKPGSLLILPRERRAHASLSFGLKVQQPMQGSGAQQGLMVLRGPLWEGESGVGDVLLFDIETTNDWLRRMVEVGVSGLAATPRVTFDPDATAAENDGGLLDHVGALRLDDGGPVIAVGRLPFSDTRRYPGVAGINTFDVTYDMSVRGAFVQRWRAT